jgi:hypothetical protein
VVAALLLLWNPPFWYSALTNPVRLSLSAGALGVAFCVFRALRFQSSAWLVSAAALLGLAAGFRPTLALLLAPLMAWAVLSLRPGTKSLAAAGGAFSLAVLLWLPFLTASTGGVAPFLRLIQGYSYDSTRDTSLLAGAPAGAAVHMVAEAIVWSGLGVLSWIWALPWAVRRNPSIVKDCLVNRFLMLWFLPGLVFYAAYHVGDPDHTLSIVPATCLIGARVLATFRERSNRICAVGVGVAMLLNVFLFFKSLGMTATLAV